MRHVLPSSKVWKGPPANRAKVPDRRLASKIRVLAEVVKTAAVKLSETAIWQRRLASEGRFF